MLPFQLYIYKLEQVIKNRLYTCFLIFIISRIYGVKLKNHQIYMN